MTCSPVHASMVEVEISPIGSPPKTGLRHSSLARLSFPQSLFLDLVLELRSVPRLSH
jgi:hypothetical protein